MTEPQKYPRRFEVIDKKDDSFRLKVPHGWVVYLGSEHGDCAAVFVPDEKHEWVLEDE